MLAESEVYTSDTLESPDIEFPEDTEVWLATVFNPSHVYQLPVFLLVRAILEDALISAISPLRMFMKKSTTRDIKDARGWIESDDDTWVFSFRNCCDYLEVNPHNIRRAVMYYNGNRRRRLWDKPCPQ